MRTSPAHPAAEEPTRSAGRTTRSSAAGPDRRRAIARRRGVALLVLVLTGAAIGSVLIRPWDSSTSAGEVRSAPVRVMFGDQVITQIPAEQLRQPGVASRLLAALPAQTVVQQGRATIVARPDRQAFPEAVQSAAVAGGGTLTLPRQVVSSSVQLPVIKQLLTNNCEVTALSMLLLDRDVHVGQLALQRQVAHARPLSPQTSANGAKIWGDPSLGFVGQAAGYGYGVYQGPIVALAQQHGVSLTDLSSQPPQAIYNALLAGHPVMAWVALGAGPYESWQTPAGATVHATFGEHSVVLTGLKGNALSVNDPLTGQRLTWTKSAFERMWAGLGDRAVAA